MIKLSITSKKGTERSIMPINASTTLLSHNQGLVLAILKELYGDKT